jgi:calcium-dependent protein kinase
VREGSDVAADAPLAGSVVQRLQRYATYAHLKQVVLRLITEEMGRAGRLPAVARALRDLFARLDADGNGELTVDELAAGLRNEGYAVGASEVRQLMAAIDLNRDGCLQDSEFLATMIDWPAVMTGSGDEAGGGGGGVGGGGVGGDGGGSSGDDDAAAARAAGEWDAYVSAAFARLDRDGDGFIDLDELLAELPPAYLYPVRSSMSMGGSPNGSPAGSRDTAAAGSAAASAAPSAELLAAAERERVAEAKRMLREADENGDGRISREEFANLLRHSVRDDLALYDSRMGGGGGGGSSVDAGGAAAAAAAAAGRQQKADARR